MSSKRGFTLIELLVVVAVIGILAAIMFPVFARAREAARKAVCMSNLKQLTLSFMMYVEDNDGGFVPAQSEDNMMRWHGVRSSLDEPFDPKEGPLWDYMRNKDLKECPSFAADVESTGQFEQGTGGYGYNAQYVGGSPMPWLLGPYNPMYIPAKQEDIQNPSKTVMLTDSAFLDSEGKLIEYSFCEAPFYAAYGMSPADPTTHFRHHELANVSFCDGHAKAMPMALTHASGWWLTVEDYQKNDLGFLGEDNSLYDRE